MTIYKTLDIQSLLIILMMFIHVAKQTSAICVNHHMNTLCGSTIDLSNSTSTCGVIKLSRGYHNDSHPCRFHIQARPNEYLDVTVQKMHPRSCVYDRLNMYDDIYDIGAKLCRTRFSNYTIHSGRLTLDFRAYPGATNETEFVLQYTAYRYCNSNEFRCHNKKCIPIELKCDGILNCLDGSDELNCLYSTNGRSTTTKTVLSASSKVGSYGSELIFLPVITIVLIIILSVICLCCTVRHFMKKRTPNSRDNARSQVVTMSSGLNSEARVNPAYDHETLSVSPETTDLPPDYISVVTEGIGVFTVLPPYATKAPTCSREPAPPSYDEVTNRDNEQRYPEIT